mmetsp:Transcript_80405/g.172098  ORF Transcript_80405/g.172098 Transcript_80405/m.172098 type:complete len:126 (-) Transcript_80405:145-522(-)
MANHGTKHLIALGVLAVMCCATSLIALSFVAPPGTQNLRIVNGAKPTSASMAEKAMWPQRDGDRLNRIPMQFFGPFAEETTTTTTTPAPQGFGPFPDLQFPIFVVLFVGAVLVSTFTTPDVPVPK